MSTTIQPLIQEYTVDFASNNNFLFVKAVQGDGHTTRYADISLMNNGQPYTVDESQVTAVIRGTKPDGTQIFNTCQILDKSTIRVEITQQMSAVPGKVDCEISIMSNTENRTLTSFPFFINVSPSSFDVGYIVSSNEFTFLIEKINEANQAISDANQATADLTELNNTVTEQEDARVEAEKQRESNEDIRKSNEKGRVSAEDARVKAENARVSAENARVEAENLRVEAEKGREKAEEGRVAAEEARVEAENARVSAETTRTENEDARKQAEIGRENAEDTREANETIRKKNESTRAENENTRQSNETTRQSNEATRQSNESQRQADTAEAIANANAATTAAMEAVEDIQHAIGIDDTKESYTTVWSSQHTMDMVKERYYKKSIKNVTISPNDWVESKFYIYCDKIHPDSVIDIYYDDNSLEAVDEAFFIITQSEGQIEFLTTVVPTTDIVIADILIENYTIQEEYTTSASGD